MPSRGRPPRSDEINAASIDKMMTGADKTVNKLLDVLQFGENGESITSDSKKLAREMMTRLGNPAAFNGMKKTVEMTSTPVKFKFTLQDSGTVLAKFTLDNGNSFSIDTGLDGDGLVDGRPRRP